MKYDKLVFAKQAKNLTNREIAEKTGVPESTVTRILAGQTENPSFSNIADIAAALGVSLDELTGAAAPAAEAEPQDLRLPHISEQLAVITAACEQMQQYAKVKDKWILRMFVYCCVITFILVALLASLAILSR